MIPGDGVGPELVHAVEEVFRQIGSPVEFETFHLSEVRRELCNDIYTKRLKAKLLLGSSQDLPWHLLSELYSD